MAFAALHALVTVRLDVIGQGSHGKIKEQGSGERKSGSVSGVTGDEMQKKVAHEHIRR